MKKLLPALFLCTCCLGANRPVFADPIATAGQGQAVAARLKAFNALLAEQWQHTLENSPEMATMIGDLRYNDRWSDLSLRHIAREHEAEKRFLRRFKLIDTTGFSDNDKLNWELMVRQLRDGLRSDDLRLYEMLLDQVNGIHLQMASFVGAIPFDNTKEYEDYLVRLKTLPRVIDQVIALSQQGIRDRLMPPKYLLKVVARQIEGIGKPAGMNSLFARPLKHFPSTISASDRKHLRKEILVAIDHDVRPAYQKLHDFVINDYAPHGRTEPGIWQLPNGDAIYRFELEQATTTHMSPEQIYQLGLSEVARIEGQMLDIAKSQGYGDLASFRVALKNDPKSHPSSREDLLGRYRGFITQMQPELPKLFGLQPKTQVTVVPVPKYREKEAPAAAYSPGTPDGSRPGRVFVNTGDYAHRDVMEIEATAYHEGIPGHHMQISIAQTMPKLPPFRQQAQYIAYMEGWGLYAEQLGKDIGFYKDPLSNYGRLANELLRADRLVLDTGVHYKHWTRRQMVDYFHAHSSEDEPSIQAETDRYIAWPGQAVAYKVGELKLLELRQRARKALGDRFDIRAFHDEILDGGALPLDILESRVDAWIAKRVGKAPEPLHIASGRGAEAGGIGQHAR